MSALKYYCDDLDYTFKKVDYLEKSVDILFYKDEHDLKPLKVKGAPNKTEKVILLPPATLGMLVTHKGLKLPEGLALITQTGSYEKKDSLEVPSVSVLHSYTKSIVSGHKLQAKANPKEVVLFCLSLLTIYQEMAFVLSEYLMDPDENVKFDPKMKLEAFIQQLTSAVPSASEVVVSTPTLRAACYMILYAKDKTFQGTTHVSGAYSKRSATLNTILFTILPTDLGSVIPMDIDTFASIGTFFDPYPKLKTALYHGVKLSTNHEMTNLYGLMAWNQLSSFKLGLEWINGPKTFLHINRTMLEQIKLFMRDLKEMKDQAGLDYPYFKYLYPTKSVADAAKYPDIIYAGKMKHFSGNNAANGSQYRLKVNYTIHNFETLFKSDLPASAIKDSQMKLTPEEKESMEELLGIHMDVIPDLQVSGPKTNSDLSGLLDFLTKFSGHKDKS